MIWLRRLVLLRSGEVSGKCARHSERSETSLHSDSQPITWDFFDGYELFRAANARHRRNAPQMRDQGWRDLCAVVRRVIRVNRLIALSIVLTVATGINAAWMCGSSCGPETQATACEHQPFATSARLITGVHCPSADHLPTAVMRDDVRRIIAVQMVIPHTAAALVVSHHVVRPHPTHVGATPSPRAPIPLRV